MKRIITLYIQCFLCIITCAQNVGIGTTTPTGPLSFDNIPGNKIVFWGDGATAHYGLGIQSGLLQLYTDIPNSDIAFGSGRSELFSERMRLINGGGDGLMLNGRITLRNGTSPLDPNYGSGIWMYKSDNSGLLGFMGVQDNQNLGFYGGPAGWGFTYDAINSRVGIGNNNPNAPLAFPPSLGKKITLYPGATGDVGFAVAGNRLQIYSDNPNADVAIGYDAAGTFNERFAVKPTGALALNGNVGQTGQELISSGPGLPAAWVNRPTVIFFNKSGAINLGGSSLCADIGGVNGQSFSLGSNSFITYQFSIPLFANNGAFGGSSRGGISIQILNNAGTVVSQGSSQFEVSNFISRHIHVVGIGDLPAGTYSVRARLIRNSTADGATNDNFGVFGSTAGCNDIPINSGQLIIQVFPK
ncbi:MAG: hypothetical protein ABI760_15940 [Ferruginibacter sp.]